MFPYSLALCLKRRLLPLTDMLLEHQSHRDAFYAAVYTDFRPTTPVLAPLVIDSVLPADDTVVDCVVTEETLLDDLLPLLFSVDFGCYDIHSDRKLLIRHLCKGIAYCASAVIGDKQRDVAFIDHMEHELCSLLGNSLKCMSTEQRQDTCTYMVEASLNGGGLESQALAVFMKHSGVKCGVAVNAIDNET